MKIPFGLYTIVCVANQLAADLSEGQRKGPIIGYDFHNGSNQQVRILKIGCKQASYLDQLE
jgi:hypothetical protein